MSLPPSVLSTKPNPLPPTSRNDVQANFSNKDYFLPRIWEAQDFISISPTSDLRENTIYEERLDELKEELVKTILSLASNDPFKALEFVDKIQQLGVAYHFETEIEDILLHTYNDQHFVEDYRADLYYTSLRFCLLRQAGFYVSPDIFNKYRNEEGEFHASLASDVRGMLSLHEATYLSIQGEDILDYAKDFTTKHLSFMVSNVSHPLKLHIQRALSTPLQFGVERVHARHYISVYQEDNFRNEKLLEFAKLDFNFVQLLHKKEITEISEWWEKITTRIKPKLPFQFRDRMLEAYVICMGANFEPRFSLGRIHLTKMWCIYTIFDDVHDVYGNIEELGALHDALQRWDTEDLDELVDHMKIIFHEMKNLFKEIEEDMLRKGHSVGMPSLKNEIKIYMKSQFEEAKIMHSGNMPTTEAWLSLSTITAGLNPFLVVAMMNLGQLATKEVFDWIDSMPRILTTYQAIIRLLDDIAGYKQEKEKGILMISNVTCYMKQYGVSEKKAIQNLQMMIRNFWKDMNKDILRPSLVPRPIFKMILSLVWTVMGFYTECDGDWYTNPKGQTKELITLLLKDPIFI